MFHPAGKHFFAGLLLLLLAVFSAVPQSVAITFKAKYVDEQGTGFNDGTPLTETQKSELHADGNSAETLGEARRNALEEAFKFLESLLVGSNTVVVEASFESLENLGALAYGGPAYSYNVSLERSNLTVDIPVAIAENSSGEELNDRTAADVMIKFGEGQDFYYGYEKSEEDVRSENRQHFLVTAVHEVIHGLGFYSSFQEDGSLGESAPSIYDVNLYSERHNKLLVNLSDNEERREAITSGTGLLWDGTRNGENSYSCAQLVGARIIELVELGQSDISLEALDRDGKPLLYAPHDYELGSSVLHLSEESGDIMNPGGYAEIEDIELTLGILRDMSWKLNRSTVQEKFEWPEELLSKCTVADNETVPSTPPASDSGNESAGGCSVAGGDESTMQTTMLNLFLVLSGMFLAFLSGNRLEPERENL